MNKVTISQYLEITKLDKTSETYEKDFLAILGYNNYSNYTQKRVNGIIKEYNKLINSEPKKRKISKYVLIKYRLFVIATDLLEEKAENFAYFDRLIQQNKDNLYEILPEMIAVYLTPIYGKKSIGSVTRYIKENMTITKAISVGFFLSAYERKYLMNTRMIYLMNLRKQMKNHMIKKSKE